MRVTKLNRRSFQSCVSKTAVNGLLMKEPEGKFGFNTEVSSDGKKQHTWAYFNHVASHDVLLSDFTFFLPRAYLPVSLAEEVFLSNASLKAPPTEPQREPNHHRDCQ